MEQKYIEIHRRGNQEGSGCETPKGRTPKHRVAPQPRSRARSAWKKFYRFLVVVSILIIAAYFALNYLLAPPPVGEQPEVVQPADQQEQQPTETAPADPNALVRREGVYNILLAATDYEGLRTDTMMVMSYDVTQQKVGVVSIPRDTLIDRGRGHNPKLVYGTGGVEGRAEEISDMLGVPIDYYVKVDITGFIALVDYVDGVDFYVPCTMNYDDPYQNLHIHYQEGMYHLGGQQAMEVARFRKNNDETGYTDVGRTQTQQELLIALAKKVLSWGSLTKINGFVEIFNEYVETDLELKHLLYFASQAINVDVDAGVETATLEGNGEASFRGFRYCYELDPENTRDTVNRLINPFTRDLTLEDMNLVQGS